MCEKCCKTECKHCWHYTEQIHKGPEYALADTGTRDYADGGPNRRCCYCGKYESDLHGPFAPKYLPNLSVSNIYPWTVNGSTTTTNAIPWTSGYAQVDLKDVQNNSTKLRNCTCGENQGCVGGSPCDGNKVK